MRRRVALALLLCLAAAPAGAQNTASAVAIGGRVSQPARYEAAALSAMPAVEVQAAREGGATARYAGPLLWPLLEAAQPIDDAGTRGAHLQHVLLARGADGYAVALAVGEVDPGFEGKSVIIAVMQDGAALAAPRLIVPGDRRAGRNVRDLVAIEVR